MAGMSDHVIGARDGSLAAGAAGPRPPTGLRVMVVEDETQLDDDPAQGRYVRTVRGVGYRMGTGQ